MKKVNTVRPKNENNFLRLLLSLKLAEYKIAAESFSEIVFFLVQYSFLFEDTEKVLNSCGTEQCQLYALQENRDLGARYLNPKYSMWISTDPALGEYIPMAPINDEAKRHNQNLPGMGGIFNHINSNLYHYAGNNPVRYIDPDGRDIIQLLDPNGARVGPVAFGHVGALIGNDKDGWLYYSNDGESSIDVQWFATKEEFFEEYKETRGAPFNYTENIRVETNTEQDKAMQDKAFELAGIDSEKGFAAKETGERMLIKDTRPSEYNFLSNNCSEHVAEIAEAGGLFTTANVIPKLQWIGTYEDYVKIYGSPYLSF